MLRRLKVRNLAIVESVEAEFGEGLNVITGETGAGKSVLMGALQLALGGRADADAVRSGEKEARIEAEFDLASSKAKEDVAAFLDEKGLPECEDGLLLIRRTISSGGGGRVHINDATSTVQSLKALGKMLVDIHGPTDHQSLLLESFQRSLLDSYAEDAKAMDTYAEAWSELEKLGAEKKRLSSGVADVTTECELLRYAVNEIDEAKLSEEDGDELVERHAAAAHASELVGLANEAGASLGGDEMSAANCLIAATQRLREMAKWLPAAKEWIEQCENLTVEVQDLFSSVEDYASGADVDPETLQALDDRLSLVQKLKRKYGQTVAEILEACEAKRARLAELEGRDGRLAALEGEIASAREKVLAQGRKLSVVRAKAAASLAKCVTKELNGLGFLQAGFDVKVAEREPDASGIDAVTYLFEPNPGEASRPLGAIASSGEIARVMLAVKSVLAEHDSIPVLVFDEIDSNIGGEVGRAVGERLRKVAKLHQVITITHLPQSAVYGERHLVVSKKVRNGRTSTGIVPIEGEARVAEIARMLGGANLTSVVTAHARELLEKAADFRGGE